MAFETMIAIRKGVCERAYGERLLSIIKWALRIEPVAQPNLKAVETFAKKAKSDKKNVNSEEIVMAVARAEGEWTLLSLPYEEYEQELRFAIEQFSL